MPNSSVTLEEVFAAQKRICNYIRTTPLLESELLNKQLGCRLLLKAEGVQHTGAFKLRGAFNNILQLSAAERQAGVFAMSAGNHAQGLAYAAQTFGVPVTILMPQDAPQAKIANTLAYGAEVVFYNRDTEDREVIGRNIAEQRGLRLIHSFNDPRTIVGQGTTGLEIHQQCRDIGVSPEAIIVNCSGGGLTSGIALTRDLYSNPPQIYAAEPHDFDDAGRSLKAGKVVQNQKTSGSICDALLLNLGDITFPILLQHKVKGLSASDTMVQAAMSLAADVFKLVVEPGGAVALATACLNRQQFQGQTVVAIASGSNVDPEAYVEHIRAGFKQRNCLLNPHL